MKIVNPGNILPFYASKRWQRHRQIGQNVLPFGLIAPNVRLIPFQLFVETGSPGDITFVLVNAADESETITQSPALLEVREKSDTGFWVTWKADANLTEIPACGFWYVKISSGEDEYFSEVLHLKPDATFDTVGLVLVADSCAFETGTVTIGVTADDDLAAPPASQTVEYFDDLGVWSELGPTGGTINYQNYPPLYILVRRTVVTAGGQTITANFKIIWSDSLDPCSDIYIEAVDVISSGGVNVERWRLRLKHLTDKGTVLYQTGYEQQYYLLPVFNVPLNVRETDITEDGFGGETARFTRTVERLRWEGLDIPDYLIHAMSTMGDLDQYIVEEVSSGNAFDITNVEFTTRRQSPGLSIGEWAGDRRIEVFSGCQPNFALVE